jgi:hypothetical protein
MDYTYATNEEIDANKATHVTIFTPIYNGDTFEFGHHCSYLNEQDAWQGSPSRVAKSAGWVVQV